MTEKTETRKLTVEDLVQSNIRLEKRLEEIAKTTREFARQQHPKASWITMRWVFIIVVVVWFFISTAVQENLAQNDAALESMIGKKPIDEKIHTTMLSCVSWLRGIAMLLFIIATKPEFSWYRWIDKRD